MAEANSLPHKCLSQPKITQINWLHYIDNWVNADSLHIHDSCWTFDSSGTFSGSMPINLQMDPKCMQKLFSTEFYVQLRQCDRISFKKEIAHLSCKQNFNVFNKLWNKNTYQHLNYAFFLCKKTSRLDNNLKSLSTVLFVLSKIHTKHYFCFLIRLYSKWRRKKMESFRVSITEYFTYF